MRCQNLFSGENKKNIVNLSSAILAQRVVKVKYVSLQNADKIKLFANKFVSYKLISIN